MTVIRIPTEPVDDGARFHVPAAIRRNRARSPSVPVGPLADMGLLAASRWQHRSKRFLDVVASALLLVLLLPLMALVALLVVTTSRGPVLYRQVRVGLHGRCFGFYKFRTMYRDADRHREHLEEANEASGPVFKIRRDPRITLVGRVLRKTSLDELPQLASVLVGTMSLVGPRPPLPDEVADYSDRERQRLLVKPGLTCIWQVSGRSDVDFDQWVDMDLAYIREWTPLLDLWILVATLPAVVSGRGAY